MQEVCKGWCSRESFLQDRGLSWTRGQRKFGRGRKGWSKSRSRVTAGASQDMRGEGGSTVCPHLKDVMFDSESTWLPLILEGQDQWLIQSVHFLPPSPQPRPAEAPDHTPSLLAGGRPGD